MSRVARFREVLKIPASAVRLRPLHVRSALVRWRYNLQLLVGERVVLFCVLDALLVIYGVYQALLGSNGVDETYQLYVQLVVMPLLLLALPSLASTIFVERRSGSLDLALSVQSTERYFVRRVAAITGIFVLQGVVAMAAVPHPNPVARFGAVLYACVVPCLIAAIVLFWAVRVRSAGGVFVASLGTALLLSKWLFADPFPPRGTYEEPSNLGRLLGLPAFFFEWGWNLLILAGTALVFYLYAQRRLRRPESIL